MLQKGTIFTFMSKLQFHYIYFFLQKAKKKPIKKLKPADLGIDTTPRIEVVSVVDPPVRQAGSIVPDVDTLLSKLKERGHIK